MNLFCDVLVLRLRSQKNEEGLKNNLDLKNILPALLFCKSVRFLLGFCLFSAIKQTAQDKSAEEKMEGYTTWEGKGNYLDLLQSILNSLPPLSKKQTPQKPPKPLLSAQGKPSTK